jgi:cytochrome c biogenesis protein CcmG, thiol:disulfide interchange protein DsbE
MKRLLYLLPALVFLVLVGYFAKVLVPGRDPEALPSALIDKPVPGFTLAAVDSTKPAVSDAALHGRVVLVNFFASWCAPCHLEHPLLLRLAKEGAALYGIDYKDKREDAAHFLAQLGNPFRAVGWDGDGRVGIDFGVAKLPETFVIDKTGRIRYRLDGQVTEENLEKALLPLLRQLEKS